MLEWTHGSGTFDANIIQLGGGINQTAYFEDAGQRSPVRDITDIVQYNTIAAWLSVGTHPMSTTIPRHIMAHCLSTDRQNRCTLGKLYIDC